MAQVTAAEMDVLTRAGFTPEVIAVKSDAFIRQTLSDIMWGDRFSAVSIEGQTFGTGEETFVGAFQAELREGVGRLGAGLENLGVPSLRETGKYVLLGLALWLAIKLVP